MSLQDLDDRWLPQAAARVRAWVDALQRLRASVRPRGVALERLDDRWADGPLGPLRRHPVLGVVLALAVALAGISVAVVREGSGGHRRVPVDVSGLGSSYGGIGGTTLGPRPGTDVGRYVATATQGLVTAVHSSPRQPRVALVSLSAYVTPEGAQRLLRGYAVSLVFLRAPAAGRNATPFPVQVNGDVLKALRVAYADTARSREQAARSYQTFVDTLKGDSRQDKTFRSLYQAFATAAALEARAYAGNCACAYAALVTATPTQLLGLQAERGVRAVEVAAAGVTSAQVQALPLLPEVSGKVPPAPGGGSLR